MIKFICTILVGLALGASLKANQPYLSQEDLETRKDLKSIDSIVGNSGLHLYGAAILDRTAFKAVEVNPEPGDALDIFIEEQIDLLNQSNIDQDLDLQVGGGRYFALFDVETKKHLGYAIVFFDYNEENPTYDKSGVTLYVTPNFVVVVKTRWSN